METEGRYALVGTLVLAVIALMTLAIVWLAGAADTIAYQTYTIYFRQQSLDGLGGLVDELVGLGGVAACRGAGHAVLEVLVEQQQADALQRLGDRGDLGSAGCRGR